MPAPPPLAWAVSHAALPSRPRARGDALRLYCSTRDARRARRASLPGGSTLDAERASFDDDAEPITGLGPLGAFDDARRDELVRGRAREPDVPVLHGLEPRRHRAVLSLHRLRRQRGRRPDLHEGLTRAGSRTKLGRPVPDRFAVGPGRETVGGACGTCRGPIGRCTRGHIGSGTTSSTPNPPTASSGARPVASASTTAIPTRDAIARPCVVKDGDLYRMWYCSRGEAYRIGYAESEDGLAWERLDEEAGIDSSATGWDNEMQALSVRLRPRRPTTPALQRNGYGATGIGHAVLGAHALDILEPAVSTTRDGGGRNASRPAEAEPEGFPEEAFDHLAALEDGNFWFRSRSGLIAWAVGRYFPQASRLLEIGCGTGVVLARSTAAFRRCGSSAWMPARPLESPPAGWMPGSTTRCTKHPVRRAVRRHLRVRRPRAHRRGRDGARPARSCNAERRRSAGDRPPVPLALERRGRLRPSPTALHETRDRREGRTGRIHRSPLDGMGLHVAPRGRSLSIPGPPAGARYDPCRELRISRAANRVFELILDSEAAAIRAGLTLPFGASRLVIARKP